MHDCTSFQPGGCRVGFFRKGHHGSTSKDFDVPQLLDDLIKWEFLGILLDRYALQPLESYRSAIVYAATMLKEAQ